MLPLPFLFLMLCGSRGAVKGTSPMPTELTVLQGDSISQALAGGGEPGGPACWHGRTGEGSPPCCPLRDAPVWSGQHLCCSPRQPTSQGRPGAPGRLSMATREA